MKKTIYALLIFIGTQLVCTVIAMAIICITRLSTVMADGGTGSIYQNLMSGDMVIPATILGLILSQIATFAILWKIDYFKPADLVKPVPQKLVLLSIPFILLAMFVLNMTNSAFDLPNLMEDEFNKIAASVWGMLAIAVFGPVIEELVFRRVMIDDMTAKTGKAWVAILISSALFGLIHMNPAQVAFAIPVGVVFGWIYVKTGSMLPGLVGHIINNSFAVFEMRVNNGGTFIPEELKFYQDPVWAGIFTACILTAGLLAVAIHRSCSPRAAQDEDSSEEGRRYVR